jgi:hypothetical protein
MSAKPPASAAPPPSSRPPEPPSESGKYLAVVGLLAAALAGLLFWKHSQTPPDIAPIPSASVPVHSSAPPPDTADIPPPPPAIPDASADTGTKVVQSGPAGDGCGQKSCNGKATPELQAALAFRAKTAHKCYDEALSQDSTLKGQVKINVRVGYSGAVCAAEVGSSELSNPSVAACIATRMRQGARLPPPVGGCIEAEVPIALRPPH